MKSTVTESYLASRSLFTLAMTLVIVYIAFFTIVPENQSLASGVIQKESHNQISVSGSSSEGIMQVALGASTNGTSTPTRLLKTGQPTNRQTSYQTQSTQTTPQPVLPTTTPTGKPVPSFIVSSQQLFSDDPTPPSSLPQATQVVAPHPESLLPEQILYLSGTHHRQGVMKSAKYLGIDGAIQYVLKNNDNTHFAYLGKELPQVADTLASLGGKSLAILDKNDIHVHGLFGDKVIFLQVPQYIGIKQLFFVYFTQTRDRWFIQVDADIFETTKPLLRELFTKRYNR